MKIQTILFPIDFSERSLALNPEVEWLAKRCDARVTLMHVFEIPVSWYGSGEAAVMSPDCLKQFSEDAKKRMAEYPINLPAAQVDRVIVQGDIAWHIQSWVEEHKADLVMMGTHGYGVMRRVLLGSVAMKVLHDVDCPVWTHSPTKRRSETVAISHILCPLELDDESLAVLRFTKELADDFSASVRIVHSVPETESRPYKYFDRDFHGFLMKSAAEEISRLQAEAGTDFPVNLTGRAIGEYMAELAVDQPADLIVLGRGRTRQVFGTVRTHTFDILRQAPCPVLSYCPPAQKVESENVATEHAAQPATIA